MGRVPGVTAKGLVLRAALDVGGLVVADGEEGYVGGAHVCCLFVTPSVGWFGVWGTGRWVEGILLGM